MIESEKNIHSCLNSPISYFYDDALSPILLLALKRHYAQQQHQQQHYRYHHHQNLGCTMCALSFSGAFFANVSFAFELFMNKDCKNGKKWRIIHRMPTSIRVSIRQMNQNLLVALNVAAANFWFLKFHQKICTQNRLNVVFTRYFE